MLKKTKRLWAGLLAGLMILGSMNGFSLEAKAESYGENLIVNPNFAEGDLSAWGAGQGNATITTVAGDNEIYDGITTYGQISDRTSPYECFAQDITAVVENGKEYHYSFFAKLSEDYEGAPADQRELHFAPYVTVNGQTSYLGSYSGELTGTCTQTLTPGEWTRYEGTFKIDYSGNIEQIVIRLLEQGNNYGQGDCVLGDYYVTAVEFCEIEKDPIVLQDVEPLRDAVVEDTQEDYIVGGAVTVNEIQDEGVAAIIRKHFNALTIGNELKPDALFGYSNSKCPGTTTDILNGEEMVVPVMDFSRAEKILDKVWQWNQEDPEHPIKIRGHVLVWHAQTPEWFFHENYDASKDYVSKEEMDKRLEWYIKTVLEHFTGEDSKYQGMFYGWDVVNEAVSDKGGYRTDKENTSESLSASTHSGNSSWWHVYGSEEYIINAFRYANKYAPADLELYYNDYNEFYTQKREDILALLYAVRDAEGTRLDGMGMQGHYSVSGPDTTSFEAAMKVYATVAGSVQITEWDITASSNYDGMEATREDEYQRIASRYKSYYNSILSLRKQGVNVTGMTFWGTIDKYSWLQSRSNVGGGTDGTRKQCPLLFDDNYNVKPAYWAFVDQDLIATNGAPVEEPVVTEEPTSTPEPEVTEAPVAEATAVPEATEVPTDTTINAEGVATEDEATEDNFALKAVGATLGGALGVGVLIAIVVIVSKAAKKNKK